MSETKTTTGTKKVNAKAAKVTKEAKTVETKKVEKKENARKVAMTVPAMSNEEMRELFIQNGCAAGSKAKSDSVVYNQFGTKSRVLQQKRCYQLLLTNGHDDVKGSVIDVDNDDTSRFVAWYEQLSDEDKKMVIGFAEMMSTKLSSTEMPRERTVKLASKDLLIRFIQYMATFPENQVVVAK